MNAYELTKNLSKNAWSRLTMYYGRRGSVQPNNEYETIISAISEHYPDLEFVEASFLVRNNIKEPGTCANCGCKTKFRPGNGKEPYPKFCSYVCRSTAQANPAAEEIIIDGVEYRDFVSAMDATGLDRQTIRRRIFMPAFPAYMWVGDHDAKCIEKMFTANPKLCDKQYLLDWKSSGKPLGWLNEQLGVHPDTIRYALLYHEIDSGFLQIPKDVKDTFTNQEEFTKLFESMSMELMASKFGVWPGTIIKYAKQYGLKPKQIWSRSKSEIELYEFILSICPDAVPSIRTLVPKRKLELDIFVPSKNIGFEFNGVFTHSTLSKDKDYHREKHLAFRAAGIRYVQIWEDSWLNNRPVVYRFISNLLGKNSDRIGARKTKVVEISQQEFDTFMTSNHMQGTTRCKIRVGLKYDNMIVAAMGFRKVPSNIKWASTLGEGLDLSRYANTNVTGGFTKMLHYVEKAYPSDFISSFADLELVSPFENVYSKNGFVVIKELAEDYRYFGKGFTKREHKSKYRKTAFKTMGFDINNKTEENLADEAGFLVCYDSGKIHYIKKYTEKPLVRPVKKAVNTTHDNIIQLDC